MTNMLLLGFWLACAFLLSIETTQARSKRNTDDDTVVTGEKLDEFIADVGPGQQTDLVLLLDRSKGMGRDHFYRYVRGYTMQLLLRYTVLHPEHTRVAIVTFAIDTTTVVDYISTAPTAATCNKGHLFYSETPPMDDVVFVNDKTVSAGTNLKAGFSVVRDILKAGKVLRPSAKQVAFVITDGAYEAGEGFDPFSVVKALKDNDNVKVYAFGLGVWLRSGQVREIATHEDYYGEKSNGKPAIDQFADLLAANPRGAWTADTPPLWTPVAMALCPAECAGHLCMTDALTGNAQCVCPAGYEPDTINGTFVECKQCYWHTYKTAQGNEKCEPCPAHHVTSAMGATAKDECFCQIAAVAAGDCDANTIKQVGVCDPVCAEHAYCRDYATYGQCFCKDGYEDTFTCATNIDNCPSQSEDPVCGPGTCVDGVNLFSCACPLGYMGKHCEMNVDECAMDVCDNNATCTDLVNDWECSCVGMWKGDACQTMIVTTTLAPEPGNQTSANVTNPMPVVIKTGLSQFWIIVIGAAAGGVVFLFVIICIICTCVMQKRRKRAEKDAAAARLELDTLKRERKGRGSSARRYRKTITQTLSQAFSGFWKRRGESLRGEDNDGGGYGTAMPSAPPRQRPDILGGGGEAQNGTEEVVIAVPTNKRNKRQSETNAGMEGWQAYLTDLAASDIIVSGLICDVDSEKHAVTTNYRFTGPEIHRLHDMLISNKRDSAIGVQGWEFFIDDNDGVVAHGQTTSNASLPHVVYFGRTRKFLVVLMATDDGAHAINVKKELKWIIDHISGEGY